jgi:hypothetical protein
MLFRNLAFLLKRKPAYSTFAFLFSNARFLPTLPETQWCFWKFKMRDGVA